MLQFYVLSYITGQWMRIFGIMKPLVSVIIPTYNMCQWIDESIDSVLAQSYPHCEIIVVDDGSADGTRRFLHDKYGSQILYAYQENRGRAAARNEGFSLSQGKLIQFFDADDIMEPHALDARVAFLQKNTEYAVAYSHTCAFYDDDPDYLFEKANRRRENYISGDILLAEIESPFLGPPMTLLRREWVERVGGMDESLERNEDWHFFMKIAVMGGRFAFVDGPPVARFRVRREISLDSAARHLWCGVRALQKIRPLAEERSDYRSRGIEKAIEKAIGLRRYSYGCKLMRLGRVGEGSRQVLKSFRENQDQLLSKLVRASVTALR